MLQQILAIALNTFLESVRQPIYFVLLLTGGVMQVMNTLLSAYSMSFSDSTEVSGDNKMLLDMGLATVFVIATLLAAFIATAVLSREIQDKTVLTVISKPVGRTTFILGKYIGALVAVLLGCVILLIFFQFALRHEVMSTAKDHMDGPVVLFGSVAILLAFGFGIWGNFFYGWVFSSITVYAMAPLLFIAWLLMLIINKDWSIQPPHLSLKPQVMLASLLMLMAMPVLTAVALVASTRLGQVMTIMICAGVFVLGLLSNHMFGRGAFLNHPIAAVAEALPQRDRDSNLSDATDSWTIRLDQPPKRSIHLGDALYFGSSPNGLSLINPKMDEFKGDPGQDTDLDQSDAARAIVVRSIDSAALDEYTIVNSGSLALPRPIEEGDFVFLEPTNVNPVMVIAWGITPNLQNFWLVDAITQKHDIPGKYVGLVAIYSLLQVTGLLSLAVILFQNRDVG